MVSQGRSNASIQRAVVGVRSFYKFFKAESLIDHNPVKDFTTAKVNELIRCSNVPQNTIYIKKGSEKK